jgi:hypothetical protein
MLSADYIRSLRGDRECIAALAYCADRAQPYPPGQFTPPLAPKKAETKWKSLVGLSVRLGRRNRGSISPEVKRIDLFDGENAHSLIGSSAEIAAGLSRHLLRHGMAGALSVTSGAKRGVLDCFLSSVGPSLLLLGYTLHPCLSAGAVSFIDIRRGHRKWTITYLETATGNPSSITLALAQVATAELSKPGLASRNLYRAGVAYALWLHNEFGVVMRPTAGMTAMSVARRHLPADVQKWRPVPLLVAMERVGIGYRAGITYARRYRGSTWKIDVNRQYTHALRAQLPLAVTFGRWKDDGREQHGVFVCRVRTPHPIHYPVGVWRGNDTGFEAVRTVTDDVVCVLHTAEFRAIEAAGGSVTPTWGYTYTRTFTLGQYVERLQDILSTHGKESPQGKLCKPLGNYIYGKFAQQPKRLELMFSRGAAPPEWHPYIDLEGQDWPEVWERTVTRHTASQHVDIAATITAAARSQTMQTWAWLSALGFSVVRCHTDSLTVDGDASSALPLDSESIGSWRLDAQSDDTVIIGANAYFDSEGAHIAGVSEPTYEMIEQAYDGGVVRVFQTENAPRRGFDRERRIRERSLRSTAT